MKRYSLPLAILLLIGIMVAPVWSGKTGNFWKRVGTILYPRISGDTIDPASVPTSAAKILTAQAESSLSAEVNLGALTTGILKHTVAAGVSTPATAAAGTDYHPIPSIQVLPTTGDVTPAAGTVGAEIRLFSAAARTADVSFLVPSGTPVNGQLLKIRLLSDGSARAITWNAIYTAGTDIALPTTTVASKTARYQFEYNAVAVKWELIGVVGGY